MRRMHATGDVILVIEDGIYGWCGVWGTQLRGSEEEFRLDGSEG